MRSRKPGKNGTGNLTEAKLIGKIGSDDIESKKCKCTKDTIKSDIEVQFVYTGNANESGFNKHEIYDLKKVLSAACRLMGTLTVANIKVAVRATL